MSSGLEKNIETAIEQIENELMVPIQAFAYKNASDCFSRGGNRQSRNGCVERVMHPAGQAQDYIAGEVRNIEERVNRCAQMCHDDIVGYGSNTGETKDRMDLCVQGCMEKASGALPAMMDRVRTTLKPLMPPNSEITKGTILSQQSAPKMPGLPNMGAGLPNMGGLPNLMPNMAGLPPMTAPNDKDI